MTIAAMTAVRMGSMWLVTAATTPMAAYNAFHSISSGRLPRVGNR